MGQTYTCPHQITDFKDNDTNVLFFKPLTTTSDEEDDKQSAIKRNHFHQGWTEELKPRKKRRYTSDIRNHQRSERCSRYINLNSDSNGSEAHVIYPLRSYSGEDGSIENVPRDELIDVKISMRREKGLDENDAADEAIRSVTANSSRNQSVEDLKSLRRLCSNSKKSLLLNGDKTRCHHQDVNLSSKNSCKQILAYFTANDHPEVKEDIVNYKNNGVKSVGTSVTYQPCDSYHSEEKADKKMQKQIRKTISRVEPIVRNESIGRRSVSNLKSCLKHTKYNVANEKKNVSFTMSHSQAKIIDNNSDKRSARLEKYPGKSKAVNRQTSSSIRTQNRVGNPLRWYPSKHVAREGKDRVTSEIFDEDSNCGKNGGGMHSVSLMACTDMKKRTANEIRNTKNYKPLQTPVNRVQKNNEESKPFVRKPEVRRTGRLVVDKVEEYPKLKSLEKRRNNIRDKLLRSQLAPASSGSKTQERNLNDRVSETRPSTGQSNIVNVPENLSETFRTRLTLKTNLSITSTRIRKNESPWKIGSPPSLERSKPAISSQMSGRVHGFWQEKMCSSMLVERIPPGVEVHHQYNEKSLTLWK